MPTLNRYSQHPELAEFNASQKLISLVDESLNKGSPVLLFLSGGVWTSALGKADSSTIIHNQFLKNLTIIPLDERFEIGSNNNYFTLLSLPIINSLLKLGVNSISTIPDKNENVNTFSQRIDNKLKEYLALNPNATLISAAGIGGEINVPGHTAGIEPMENIETFNNYFKNPNVLYCGYLAQKLSPSSRATATFSLFDKINYFVMLILDFKKTKKPLDLILSKNPPLLNKAPCVYFSSHPNVDIFTDIPE